MIVSVTKQIIEIIGEQIMADVAAHPEVKDAENILNTLMEIIFEGNPELYDKVENAIYEYSETFAKHTLPLAFAFGLKMMDELTRSIITVYDSKKGRNHAPFCYLCFSRHPM